MMKSNTRRLTGNDGINLCHSPASSRPAPLCTKELVAFSQKIEALDCIALIHIRVFQQFLAVGFGCHKRMGFAA